MEKFAHDAAHILIVDDESAMLDAMSLSLEAGGYTCTAASSGFEALAAIEENNAICGVVTDLNMPGMDGITLIKLLRQVRPQLRIVVCSGYISVANHQELRDLGIPILHKPFSLSQFLDRVSQFG